MISRRRLLELSLLVTAGCGPIEPRPNSPPPFPRTPDEATETKIRDHSAPYVKAAPNSGVAIALLGPSDAHFVALGRIGYHDPRAPNGDSLFELGSMTQVFTALLLAELVAAARVRYDTPVEELLPSGTRVPSAGDRKITLLDLVTHTSGLPMMPANFVPTERGSLRAAYTPEMLYQYLGSATLASPPGARYVESELGFGLLGHALALRQGRSFGLLMNERVLAPLGMKGSGTFDRTALLEDRLVEGSDDRGQVLAHRFDASTLAGANALRSSGNDLMRFMAAVLAPGSSPLGASIRVSLETRRTLEDGSEVALGWRRQKQRDAILRDGQALGFRSAMLIEALRGRAIAVLASSARVDALALAFDLLSDFEPNQPSR